MLNWLTTIMQNMFSNPHMYTVMNTVMQIQVAQFAAILTLLSISISISHNKIFGQEIKDLLSINGGYKSTVFSVYTFAQLVLMVSSIGSLSMGNYQLMWIWFIISVALSFIICWLYVPVIMTTEARAIKIIRNAAKKKRAKTNTDQIIKALWEIAKTLGYEESIKKLTPETLNAREKGRIVGLLLDIIKEKAYKINSETPNNEVLTLCDYSEGLIYTQNETVLHESESVIGIIAATIYKTEKFKCHIENPNHELEIALRSLIRSLISRMDYCDTDDKAKVILKAFFRITKWSIEDGNTHLLKMCRDELAQFWGFHDERKNNVKTIAVFEVSRYLYYFTRCDATIPESIRKSAEDFINDSVSLNPHIYTSSWRDLFKSLIEELPISLDYYIDHCATYCDWEYSIYNVARFVILHDYSACDWWIKCMILGEQYLYSSQVENMSNVNDDHKVLLKAALQQYCDDKIKQYNVQESIGSVSALFGIEPAASYDDLSKFLFQMKNDLEKALADIHFSIPNDTDLFKFSATVKDKLIERLNQVFLVNVTSGVTNEERCMTMNLRHELLSGNTGITWGSNYAAEAIYSYLLEHIKHEIGKSNIEIVNAKNTTGIDLRSRLMLINPLYYTSKISSYMKNMPAFADIANDIEAIERDCNLIGDELLGEYAFVGNHALLINVCIEEISTRKLSDSEIEDQTKSYLREDGSYFYHGAYGDYKEVRDYVEKHYLITSAKYYLSVDVNRDRCIIIDLWGHITRRKEMAANKAPS